MQVVRSRLVMMILACFNPLRGKSVLQAVHTSGGDLKPNCFNPLRGKSVLQDRARHQRVRRGRCFNPLRGKSVLQAKTHARISPLVGEVSILYEEKAFCKLMISTGYSSKAMVSILYEEKAFCKDIADARECTAREFQSSTRKKRFARVQTAMASASAAGFNPLRGKSVLQDETELKSATIYYSSFNPLRGKSVLQVMHLARAACKILFQSSTRKKRFARMVASTRAVTLVGFNPLRGKSVLQVKRAHRLLDASRLFQSSTRKKRFARRESTRE